MADIVHIVVSYPAHVNQRNRERLDAAIGSKLMLVSKGSIGSIVNGKRIITSTLTSFDKRNLAQIERAIRALDNGIEIAYNVISGNWSRELNGKTTPPDQT